MSGFDLNTNVTRAGGHLYLFFSVNFTCQAEVSSFILLARDIDRVAQEREYPLIQIWREDSVTPDLYNRIHNIGGITSEVTFLGDSLYRYTPFNGTITVLPGDFLGLFARSDNNARINPIFLHTSSLPQYYELFISSLSEIFANNPNNFRNQYSPLIAIELAIDQGVSLFMMVVMSSDSSLSANSVRSITKTLMPFLSMSFIPSLSLTISPTSSLIMPSTHSNSSIGSTILADSSSLANSVRSITKPSLMPTTASTPLTSSTLSTILAGLIGGVIVAVVCIFTFLLIIVIYRIKKKRRNGNHSESQPELPHISSNTSIEPKNNPAYANNPFHDSATPIQDNPAYAAVNVNDLSATIQDNPAYGTNTAIMEDVPYACPSASSHTAFEENADQMDNNDAYTHI